MLDVQICRCALSRCIRRRKGKEKIRETKRRKEREESEGGMAIRKGKAQGVKLSLFYEYTADYDVRFACSFLVQAQHHFGVATRQ